MFGKGRKHNKSAGQSVKVKQGRISVSTLWVLAAIFSVSAIIYSNYQQVRHVDDAMQAAHQAYSGEAADLVSPAIRAFTQQAFDGVAALSTSAYVIAQTEQTADGSYANLGPLLAGSQRILVLPAEFGSPDTSQNPPISFAVLAQVSEAKEKLKTLPIEVHWLADEQAVVETVAPIVRDEQLAGFLLVTWPFEYFQQKLALLKPKAGYIEFAQAAPGGTRSQLVELGDKSAKQNGSAHTIKLTGSHWFANVYPGAMTGGNSSAALFPSLELWIAAIATLFFIALLATFTRQLFQKDVSVFRQMLDDAQNQRLKQRYITWFKQSQSFSDILRTQLREWTAARQFANNPGQVIQSRKTEEKAEEVEVSVDEASPEADALFHKADDESMPPELPGESPAQPVAAPTVPAGDAQEDVFDLADADAAEASASDEVVDFPMEIIRAYDIRAHAEKFMTAANMKALGQAIGSEVLATGTPSVVVGRDGRLSSEVIRNAIVAGVQASGCDVADIGLVPTPVLYFAAELSMAGGAIMVTGSHNPPEFNGLKVMIGGQTLDGERIKAIAARISAGNLDTGDGGLSETDVLPEYMRRIVEDVQVASPLKVVIDAGNGAASVLAVDLFKQLGCEVADLYCEVDGRFPNHLPDTSDAENLSALGSMVRMQDADLGIAFDGDADRVAIVDNEGEIVWPDRLMMALAIDILGRQPGSDVVFDVKCSKQLAQIVSENGGVPRMIRTGHSFLKKSVKETGAVLAGEMSGHIVFADRWFEFDDGIYAAARIVELIANSGQSASDFFATLPPSFSTPELRVNVGEGRATEIMEQLAGSDLFVGAELNTIDGIRAEFPDSWVLVRPSNTGPELCFRLEADDEAALEALTQKVQANLAIVAPDVILPV